MMQMNFLFLFKIEKDINIFIYQSFVKSHLIFEILIRGTLKNSPFSLKFKFNYIYRFIY